MKVLFVGPSLYRVHFDAAGLELRPPAGQGDVLRATLQGATAVGLVDGVFGTRAAVWHKEILFALSMGVRVLGAASMGALRAAECHAFGMQPVGVIAGRYLSGDLDDDAAVALEFAPAEFGYAPLVEALVDIEATVDNLLRQDLIATAEAARLRQTAAKLFFAERSIDRIVSQAGFAGERAATLITAFETHRVSQKERDAIELVTVLHGLPDVRDSRKKSWIMAMPAMWRRVLAEAESEVAALAKKAVAPTGGSV